MSPTHSALIGEPPVTEEDYWVAKALLVAIGKSTADPSLGAACSTPKPPPQLYKFETKAPSIITSVSICAFIMILVTALRLYVRHRNDRLRLGLDDLLIIPALVRYTTCCRGRPDTYTIQLLAVAYTSLQTAMVTYGGGGKHEYDVTYHEYRLYRVLSTIAQPTFYCAVGFTKLSITAFNSRLTGFCSRNWQITHRIFFVLVIAATLMALLMAVFKCDPILAGFDPVYAAHIPLKPDGKKGYQCMSVLWLNTIVRAVNVSMDWCLLAVPVILLFRLNMDTTKKIRLMIAFSIGALACIGSVMTLVAKSTLKKDTLWNYSTLLAWTLVELTLGVVAASLPTISALLSGRRSIMSTNPDHAPPVHQPPSSDGKEIKSVPSTVSSDAT